MRSTSAAEYSVRSNNSGASGFWRLRQHPRGALHDVLIHHRNQLPHGLQRARELEAIVRLEHNFSGLMRGFGNVRIAVGLRHLAVAILMDHAQRAAREIPESVRQVRVIPLHQRVVTEAAVLAEHDFAQQEIPQRIHSRHLRDRPRAHDVAAALAHLVLLKQQPSMREDPFGQREFGGHQERGPEDGMEPHDLFADHVQVGGPVAAILPIGAAHRAEVCNQSVEPDIEHVRRFVRNGDAPFDRGPRDRQILQAALDEADHLVAASLGLDEFGMFVVEFEQAVLERG